MGKTSNYFRDALTEAEIKLRGARLGTTVNVGTPKTPLRFQKRAEGVVVIGSTRGVLRAIRRWQEKTTGIRTRGAGWGRGLYRKCNKPKPFVLSGASAIRELKQYDS